MNLIVKKVNEKLQQFEVKAASQDDHEVIILNSSHTVAYNPNTRRVYEKSQHAEDVGRIKINLFL